MKKVERLLNEMSMSVEGTLVKGLQVEIGDIRLSVPTSYTILPDLRCMFGVENQHRNSKYAVLIPDTHGGYFLVGGVKAFKDAIIAGTPTIWATVIYVGLDMLPAIRRLVNHEDLPTRENFQTMFSMLDFYDEGGMGFMVRKDNGNVFDFYQFLSALTGEDEEDIMMASRIHWRGREDLKELLYEGEITLDEAFE